MPRGGQRKTEAIVQFVGEDAYSKHTDKIKGSLEEFAAFGPRIADSWSLWATGLNQTLEIAGKIGDALELVREAASSEALGKGFARTFERSEETIQRLRTAAGGMLADRDLQTFALDLQTANVSLEDTARVLDTAARISADRGADIKEVTEALRDTIIGASDSDLEKFGIVADLPELTKAYAREAGIAEENIDKSVESAAALKLVVGEVADRFKDVAVPESTMSQIQTLDARFQNLADRAASAAKAGLLGLAQDLDLVAEPAQAAEGRVNELWEALNKIPHSLDEVSRMAQFAADQGWTHYVNAISTARWNNQQVDEQLVKSAFTLKELQGVVKDNEFAFLTLDQRIRDMVDNSIEGALIRATMEAEDAQAELNKAVLAAHDHYGTYTEAVNRHNAALQAQADATWQAALANAELTRDKERAAAIEAARAKARREEVRAEIAFDAERRRVEEAAARAGKGGGKRKSNEELLKELKQLVPQIAGIAGIEGPVPLAGELERGRAFADALKLGEGQVGDFGDEFAGPPDEFFDRMTEARNKVKDLSMSFEAFGDTFESSFLNSLQSTAIQVTDEVGRVIDVFKQAQEAGMSTGEAVAASVPGAINAAAGIAKAWGASVEFTETMNGLADAAMAATRFAAYDYVGGAMYTVSSGMHFAAAGFAASKGGGGGAKPGGRPSGGAPRAPAPSFGGSSGGGGGGNTTITQVFSGVIVGPGGAREAARGIHRMTQDEASRGSRSPDFMPAG